MALQLSAEIDGTGVVIDYWRIARATVDFTPAAADGGSVEGTIEVVMHGYASAEMRSQGKGPVLTELLTFTSAQLGSLENMTRTGLYAAVRASPRFAAAIDV
jgi:hypothetical protein